MARDIQASKAGMRQVRETRAATIRTVEEEVRLKRQVMSNRFQKLADMCDLLAMAFLGEVIDPMPTITVSDNGKHVKVYWDGWRDEPWEIRSEIACEAYAQAFGSKTASELISIDALD